MKSPVDLQIREALARQYQASLEMLGDAGKQCPEATWADNDYPNRFWHVAYHVLFYTHLYLQQSERDFTAWSRHRPDYQFLGPTPWPPFERPKADAPYSKDEILEYHQFCFEEVTVRMKTVDLSAPSGFHWLPFSKLELQLYNLRHIQHHAGQLIERLRTSHNIGTAWRRGV